MAPLGKIARRTFLIGSAAVAGGVVFGVYAVRKPHHNPLLDDLAEGEATFNPWVKISRDGVTLITPHTDLGQGARSMQAALIAEEMDLEWGDFEVSPGVPSAAYYNRALAYEAAHASPDPTSIQAKMMAPVIMTAIKMMGVQGTGGSSSTRDSFDLLRKAGAVARETLKKAASLRTGIAVAELKTGRGSVLLPDASAIKYAELAEDAAKIKPVGDVVLRPPSGWRLIGKPMRRLDIEAKSTGGLQYTIDLEQEGMVFAALRVSPRRSALVDFDAGAAEKMRGVKKILKVTNGLAVIADNSWRAFKAAEAIRCEWAPAAYPAEMSGHWDEVAASFTPERLEAEWRNDGDVAEALAGADIIEAEYKAPYVAHQPLEPISTVIMVADDRADFWTSHQFPRIAQQKVADICGLKPDQVYLHNQYAGGSFGHRLEFENVTLAAEIAVQMKGAPVKLTFRREDDFEQDFPRQIGMARPRGVVKDGKVVAIDLPIATVSSSASQMARAGVSLPGPDDQITAGASNLPYALPNFRVAAYRVPELAPTSSWRSVGASTAGFFADCFLDELIHAADADPLAERLRLMNDDISRKVLEAVGDMSSWGSDLGPGRGRGVAFVKSFNTPVAEVIEVTMTPAGIKIDKVFVAADVGTIVDPVNFENHVQGAVVWGLGHAMNCEITYSDGIAQQKNFNAHEGMRLYQCPEIYVRGLENGPEVRGIGEPPVPPAAPALSNAIFAATGMRIREMPFNKHVKFI